MYYKLRRIHHLNALFFILHLKVADGHTDHAEWNRAENITIPRPSYKIDSESPGSDMAGEAAAAMAASSIAFRDIGSPLLTILQCAFKIVCKLLCLVLAELFCNNLIDESYTVLTVS